MPLCLGENKLHGAVLLPRNQKASEPRPVNWTQLTPPGSSVRVTLEHWWEDMEASCRGKQGAGETHQLT